MYVLVRNFIFMLSNTFEPTVTMLHPNTGDEAVAIDPRYFRPTEVEFLLADASKAKKELRWEPEVTFNQLVRIMVAADIKALQELSHCQDVIRKLINHNSKS